MRREQAIALLQLPREEAICAILELGEKAEQWERLQKKGEHTPDSPTTPSEMRPVYTKPAAPVSDNPDVCTRVSPAERLPRESEVCSERAVNEAKREFVRGK